MVHWIKLLGLYGLSATATRSQDRRDVGSGMSTLASSPTGNLSVSERQCAQLGATLNRTADLFSRQLSREEYYSRNFMWVRCRSMETKWFDMGGAWFGRDGKDLEARFWGRPMIEYQFNYVKGNWGDATLFFTTVTEMSLLEALAKMKALAEVASERYKRNLYIIDCRGQEHDPYFATERRGVPFPNPDMIQPENGNRAHYNSAKKSRVHAGRKQEWLLKHPMAEGGAQKGGAG